MPDLYNAREQSFNFRDRGGFKIPKSVRESAYALSIDIVVQTISHEKYTSDYTYPVKTHYGFVELVFQDCLSLEIPVHQPRQRVYDGRVPEAFSMWQALSQWSVADCRWYKELFLAINHGSVEEYPLIAPDDIQWKELPLLEVFFKPIEHTQWKAQILWTEPKFFTDCTGILRNGKSKMADTPHDNGLPPNGIQPQKTDPSAPFNDSLPFTSPMGTDWEDPLGTSGKANNIDPANGIKPTDPGAVWWIEYIAYAKNVSFPGACGVTRKETNTFPVPVGTQPQGYEPTPGGTLAPNGCGGYNFSVDLLDTTGQRIPGSPQPNISTDTSVSMQVHFGTEYVHTSSNEYV